MYAVFCGVHIVVLIGVFVLFLLCVRNTTSPAKLSFMLTCFSLFILIFGMYLEMVDSDTTESAISALRIQYIGMYPFSLSLLYFTSSMGGFKVPKPMWITFGVLDCASFIAMQTTGTSQEENHGLFYSTMRIESDGIYSRIEVGKGIFWLVTYAIILFIIIYIVVNLILALRKTTNKIQQRRIALILGGISAMGLELVMKWCGLFGSYNPFAFGAFVLVLCMYESMIRYGYFSSVVSAPANVLDIGDEGVFMLDEHGGLIYMNATAKRILPELSEMKNPSSHKVVKEALSGGRSTVSIDGNVYELRAERIQEFSSPCGYVIWLINMTKYQHRIDEINAANTAKTEFLARMSHEIRTPINTMLGLNEMVMRTSTNPEVLEYSADIADAGGMLLTLINEILDISKAEAGKLTIERAEYDTLTMLREIRLLVIQKAEEKGLELDFRIDPGLPRKLVGDQARIKQMAVNLLTNAVKYTQTGFVRLTACMESDTLVIQIADSGCGIPPQKLPLIFNNFERIGAVGDGVGLGLPITKNIAEIMGGAITAKSSPLPGSGEHIHAENTAGNRGRVPHRGVYAGASGAPACQRIALYMPEDRDTRRGRQPLQPRGDRKTAAAHQGRRNDCGKRRRNAPDCKRAALRPDNARRDDAGNVRRGSAPEAAQRPRQPLPGDPRCGADRGRGSRRPGALHERGLRRVPLKADNLRGA